MKGTLLEGEMRGIIRPRKAGDFDRSFMAALLVPCPRRPSESDAGIPQAQQTGLGSF